MTMTAHESIPTLADAWAKLGSVPLDRILFEPPPGTATEADVLRLHDHEDRLVELVDGFLLEKPMGYRESAVAAFLIRLLGEFVEHAGLGVVAGEAGMMRLAKGLVRIPDVSVVLWNQFPGRRLPVDPIPSLSPDLAVEVLSASNTSAEMDRKIGEYFAAGCGCVWLVDPARKAVVVCASPQDRQTLTGDEPVPAEPVLPGFRVSVEEIFRRSGVA